MIMVLHVAVFAAVFATWVLDEPESDAWLDSLGVGAWGTNGTCVACVFCC
jgi:hypothetical protein